MSRLDELIQELCPNGVEYKKLSEVATIERGRRVVKEQLSQNSGFPVFQNSLTPMGYHTDSNYPAETTFVIGAGAAGEIGYCKEDFWAADDCFPIVCSDSIISRYVFHFLLGQQPIILSKVRKASIPRLSRTVIENLMIAVPPLPVQSEIVRILDSFTEVTAELTAELTARKKQYEYYRNRLLSFSSDTKFERLGDTCRMKSGKAIPSAMISSTISEETPYACFGGNGVRGYVSDASHHGEFPIIGRQGALCGNVNYASGDFYATEHAVVVESKGEYLQRFLYYLLTSMNLNQYKSQGAQPGLAVGNLENLVAPVPSLDVQKRLVYVLDNFDVICSDLNIGLPAEIEARQKQYEFYRDALLTYAATGKIILTDRQTDRRV